MEVWKKGDEKCEERRWFWFQKCEERRRKMRWFWFKKESDIWLIQEKWRVCEGGIGFILVGLVQSEGAGLVYN